MQANRRLHPRPRYTRPAVNRVLVRQGCRGRLRWKSVAILAAEGFIRGAHQHHQPPPAMKNTVQKNWELARVVECKATPLPPATPTNSQFFWVVFFLAGGGWSHWCALHMKCYPLPSNHSNQLNLTKPAPQNPSKKVGLMFSLAGSLTCPTYHTVTVAAQ
jgi:hypothetical protein